MQEIIHVSHAGLEDDLPGRPFSLWEIFDPNLVDQRNDLRAQQLGIVFGQFGVGHIGQFGVCRSPLQSQVELEPGLNIAIPLLMPLGHIADQLAVLLH